MTRQRIQPNTPNNPERSFVTGVLQRLNGISLRARLLLFLLSVTLISILVVTLLAFDSISRIGENAQRIGGQALTDQVKTDLVQYNNSISRENDRFFEQILSQAHILAHFMQSAYEHSSSGSELGGDPQVGLTRLEQGQYANPAEAITSVFVPNLVELNDLIRRDVRSSAELDELFPSVQSEFPAVVALFFATPNQMTRFYPNINLGQVLPEDWQVTSRPWYLQAVREGSRKPWVDPYLDATGQGLVTTAAVPVYAEKPDEDCADCPSEGTLLGVVGMDVTLQELEASVEVNNLLPEASYSFMLDSAGRGIILPRQAALDITGREPVLNELVNLESADQIELAFRPIIQAMLDGRTDVVEVTLPGRDNGPERQVIVAFAPLKSTGWSLGTVIESKKVLQPLDTLQSELGESLRLVALQRFLPSLVGVLAIIFLVTLYLTERWIRPVRALAEAAAKIGRGQWDVQLPGDEEEAGQEMAEINSQDELQVLTRSFRIMKNQLFASLTALEDRVAERTKQLERRSGQLQAAADLARDINQTAIQHPGLGEGASGSLQVRDLNWLLARTVDLISQRFGFYHAGIFLIDNQREYAVLRAATGEAGRQMIERNHRLRIDKRVYGQHQDTSGKGPIGIVGSVAGTGIPRIALDTGKDVVHFKNPLLPKTRSEMALPLKTATGSGGLDSLVIGVLDVQSMQPDAFDDQDVATLQILADQLAVAIENARLFRSYQNSLSELENLYGQVSGSAWKNVIVAHPVVGYELTDELLQPLYQTDAKKLDAGQADDPYLLPVVVRGETIATIEIWAAAGGVSTLDKRLLSDLSEHLSQTFESARLFEEAQARSFREQAINEFVAQLSTSLDLESLLKSAVRQLGGLPNVAEVTISMKPNTGQAEQNR